ncbi:MAG: 3-isopropylmalate dehydratase small subunit [Desulfobacterales bacterium]|nr:MAG: 3-isopropylmalate dehydratase small subunit [Desulfobacterales bacterium]
MTTFEGCAHKFEDDINTDYIISSRRKRDTLDLNILKNYIMEDIDPEFAGKLQPGDILTAGYNFGCGSAMEVAALVLKAAGIKVVVAKSFARTFYRNAINSGLLPIEADTDDIDANDRLRINLKNTGIIIHNLTKNTMVRASAPGGVILEIFRAGGLVNYIRDAGNFPPGVSEK